MRAMRSQEALAEVVASKSPSFLSSSSSSSSSASSQNGELVEYEIGAGSGVQTTTPSKMLPFFASPHRQHTRPSAASLPVRVVDDAGARPGTGNSDRGSRPDEHRHRQHDHNYARQAEEAAEGGNFGSNAAAHKTANAASVASKLATAQPFFTTRSHVVATLEPPRAATTSKQQRWQQLETTPAAATAAATTAAAAATAAAVHKSRAQPHPTNQRYPFYTSRAAQPTSVIVSNRAAAAIYAPTFSLIFALATAITAAAAASFTATTTNNFIVATNKNAGANFIKKNGKIIK